MCQVDWSPLCRSRGDTYVLETMYSILEIPRMFQVFSEMDYSKWEKELLAEDYEKLTGEKL